MRTILKLLGLMTGNPKAILYGVMVVAVVAAGWYAVDRVHFAPIRASHAALGVCEKDLASKEYALKIAGEKLNEANIELQECVDTKNVDYLEMYYKALDDSETEEKQSDEDVRFDISHFSF